MELHSRVLTINWLDLSESWELTDSQKLLFTWLLMCFDANGVLEFNPSLILKKLDLKHLKAELEILITKMVQGNVLELFEVEGNQYAYSRHVLQSQNLRFKARLPNPPWVKEHIEAGYRFKYQDTRYGWSIPSTACSSEAKRSDLEVKNIKDKNIAIAQETIQNIRQNLQARS